MSETWPPTTGPEDADTSGPTAAGDATDPSAGPIPLGPSTPTTPSYWREYPYAGAPAAPVTPPAGEVYRPQPFASGPGYPTTDDPSQGPGAGSPTPPAGSWPAPPYPAPPYPGQGAGWSAPGAPTPPFGGWPPPPGYPAAAPTPPKRRTGLVAAVVAVFAVVAVLAGAGLGHVVWPSSTTASATGGSSATGSGGGTTSPFGSGSEGSGGSTISPFGSGSGSTGNSSTGAGAPSDISAIAAKVAPDLVDINTNLSYEDEQAAGTGMVLTSNGVILTNNHVIDGATSISVTDVGNGKTYSAKVVGYDRTGDVAVIKLVNASGLSTVSIAGGTAAVGQAVVGVGNAGGTGGTPSDAGGSITAVGQSITASDDGGGNAEHLSGLLETNAGIEPGDSGGSLVNTSGQVVGMDTAASADTGFGDTASQGYAIPIATALKLAKKIENGDATSTIHIGATGFLGVSVSSASTGTSGSGGFGVGGEGSGSDGLGGSTATGGSSATTPGADVEGTLTGSPAAKAGLVQGDVITSVNGSSVTSSTDLSNVLERYHPGDVVQVQWTNTSGQSQTAGITLESGPPA
jgi:S1-C subfamily serine protease